jgi:hypothetical protein
MPDSFTTGLFGGLIILAVLLLIFGTAWHFQPWQPSLQSQGATITHGGQNLLSTSTQIGYVIKSEEVKTIDLGNFNLTSPVQSVQHGYSGKRIFNGLLFGSDSIKISAKDVSSMEYKIDNTNGYGNLIVRVNDEIIFNEPALLGSYELEINRPGNVTIEIATSSSGWRIWAPSLYDISNITVHSYVPAAKSWGIELAANDLSRAELEIVTTQRLGSAKLKIGAKQIWSGSFANTSVIAISADDIKTAIANNQSLTLEANANSALAGSAKLKGYYIAYVPNVFEQNFEINQSTYEKLPATLRFDITSVENRGGVSVKIFSGDQLTYTNYASVEPRSYSFTLDKYALKVGTNKLLISSVDGSRFWIKDVKLLL